MKKIILSCVFLCGTLLLYATDILSLVIETKGSTESAYVLSEVQKIAFSGNNMLVSNKDGSQNSFKTANVQKFLFALRSTIITQNATNAKGISITAYPIPTSDVLFIKNVEAVARLRCITCWELLNQYQLPT